MKIFKDILGLKASDIKSKFKTRNEEIVENIPLGIKVGSFIKMDLLRYRLMEGKLNTRLPNEMQEVRGHGVIRLSDNEIIHRFYLEDGLTLQVSDVNGETSEVFLLLEYEEVTPNSDEDWKFWLADEDGLIGWPVFELPDQGEKGVFLRHWFVDNPDARARPAFYEENITFDKDGERVTVFVEHTDMMYFRWVDDKEEVPEFLLVGVEDTGSSAHVELSIGLEINPAQLSIT